MAHELQPANKKKTQVLREATIEDDDEVCEFSIHSLVCEFSIWSHVCALLI